MKRRIRSLAVALATVAIGAAGAGAGRSAATDCGGGSGGVGTSGGSCGTGRYVNPLRGGDWYAGRIDMGVDYVPVHASPVRAIGRAKVIGVQRHSGWPGGHYMWYRLLRGDHRGDIVYVAESLKHLVPAGTVVRAGEQIATGVTGGTGIEMGWANRQGQPRAWRCYTEGMKTNSGKEMARFLRSVGTELGDKPGPGPDEPSGARC